MEGTPFLIPLRKGCPEALEILVQLVILKLKMLAKEKLQSTHLAFLLLMQPDRNPQENKDSRLLVRVKSQRRDIISMQASKGFVQSQKMTSLIEISRKIWLGTQMIISTNFSLKTIYRKAFQLKTQSVLIFIHPERRMNS